MLDRVDLDRTVGKETYQRQLPKLQQRLYDLEVEIIASKIPIAIIFEGWAGTSKIGTIGALSRRLDPRGLRIHPITPPTTVDSEYPWLKRFWQRIPAYGEIGIFDRSWYREVINGRAQKNLSQADYIQQCEDIVSFERMLNDDGVILLKFLLHISKKEQQKRFEEILANRVTAIQVTPDDLWQHKHYDRFWHVTEDLLARTTTPNAPWTIIPANDKSYAQLTVLEQIIAKIEQRVQPHEGATMPLAARPAPPAPPAPASTPPAYDAASVLRSLDLSKRLDEQDYNHKLAKLQAKLYLLGLAAYKQKRPVVLVFEGWDAAGKGGTIKRITEPMDPRAYVVHAIAKPDGEDKQHHYLYRFWRRLPQRGQIAIFDRSWYGRVLVERIEGFARTDEWQRAYAEINEFERQLVDFGTIICKFWMHVSPGEQLRRFEERKAVRYKAWKLTDEDWRNRERWHEYEDAVEDMVRFTSTPRAPWHVVASEDKLYGRIRTIRTIVRQLEDELGKVKL
ncbi:polyphosphate:AMP phosphotransferase [Chloroflexia bacterium SDU3-3]|nr:polyphosphate:AMP phosphotransferase [Chloroflexia bacterium SDU3-3]